MGQNIAKSFVTEGKNEELTGNGAEGLNQENCLPEVELLAQEVWDQYLQEKKFKS